MTDSGRQQLRARLRNAERQLAQAERAQVNKASSQYSGFAGTGQGRGDRIGDLNKQIADATGVDELRSEVAQLHSQLGEDDQRGLWARLRQGFGRA
ncbi:MAG: hypothetical protein ACI970_001644 [Myxococcota bacterium]|jgi:hypothetical protein